MKEEVKEKHISKRERIKGKIKEVRSDVHEFKEGVKGEVKEAFFNVPNMITMGRLVLTFVFVYMLFADYSRLSLTIVFTIAAVSDWFDGYFARKLKQTTKIGARMDQVIDRVFTVIIVGALLIYMLNKGILEQNILLLILVCSREIIGTPGFIITLIRNKDPYKVRYIGKVMTFVQSIALGAIVLGVPWAIWIAIPTCVIGILAGFDYLKYSLS